MPLILNGLAPIHWALGGAGIAAVTLTLLFVANRRLGISTSLEDLCSYVLPTPYFRRDAVVSGRVWRLPFAVGLVFGGFLSAVLGGGWSPTWAMGMFDGVDGALAGDNMVVATTTPAASEVKNVTAAIRVRFLACMAFSWLGWLLRRCQCPPEARLQSLSPP